MFLSTLEERSFFVCFYSFLTGYFTIDSSLEVSEFPSLNSVISASIYSKRKIILYYITTNFCLFYFYKIPI